MNEYWIKRESDEEIVGNYRGRNAREALIRMVEAESLQGASITQERHGARYHLELDGERYFAERVS